MVLFVIYICGSTYEKIYLYICITCTICSIVKYQQTKKIEWKIKQKTPQTFSTGWCYQPVLMSYAHTSLAHATWSHFSAEHTKGGHLHFCKKAPGADIRTQSSCFSSWKSSRALPVSSLEAPPLSSTSVEPAFSAGLPTTWRTRLSLTFLIKRNIWQQGKHIVIINSCSYSFLQFPMLRMYPVFFRGVRSLSIPSWRCHLFYNFVRFSPPDNPQHLV